MESNCQKRLRKNRGTKLEKLSKNQRLRRLCPWDLGQKSPRKGNSWGSDRTQRRGGRARVLTDPDPEPGATFQDDIRLQTPA